ncbi:MAG: sigma 54-interacting transcriptional regulator [Myxococcales bacterium]|nr:sigma 54-interacting transcriptional regulator [Myxococcales bacterium]
MHEATLTGDATLTLGTTSLAIQPDSGLSDLVAGPPGSFGAALGVSTAMRHVFGTLERASGTDVTILLEGESGGKEVSRAASTTSLRARAAPSSPWGLRRHSRGSHRERAAWSREGRLYRGSSRADGTFEQAHGGTLFLTRLRVAARDAAEVAARARASHREARGAAATRRRSTSGVVAATNRHLAPAVADGTFRRISSIDWPLPAWSSRPLRSHRRLEPLAAISSVARVGARRRRARAGHRGDASVASLARQRARAKKCHRAPRAPRRARTHSALRWRRAVEPAIGRRPVGHAVS